MIEQPQYRKRSYGFLGQKLNASIELLDMRDWVIDLVVSDYPPEEFLDSDNGDSVSRCMFEEERLFAIIWICPKRCKAEPRGGIDPLWVLYHELGHIFHDLHNEEWRCNKIAHLLSTMKSKRTFGYSRKT